MDKYSTSSSSLHFVQVSHTSFCARKTESNKETDLPVDFLKFWIGFILKNKKNDFLGFLKLTVKQGGLL